MVMGPQRKGYIWHSCTLVFSTISGIVQIHTPVPEPTISFSSVPRLQRICMTASFGRALLLILAAIISVLQNFEVLAV